MIAIKNNGYDDSLLVPMQHSDGVYGVELRGGRLFVQLMYLGDDPAEMHIAELVINITHEGVIVDLWSNPESSLPYECVNTMATDWDALDYTEEEG